ncbi:MAG TPA: KamA family radical SAM protein, partial [Desulfobulbaceae bacterium]|nr:KamA family radical SAM protein [Desulfobulbaceae bacterium]
MTSSFDTYTTELLDSLYCKEKGEAVDATVAKEVGRLLAEAEKEELTGPIVVLFDRLQELRRQHGWTAQQLNIERDRLEALARKHQELDEHMVSVGGRVGQALAIVDKANKRVDAYLDKKDQEAPSGIELWDRILENQQRIREKLGMDEREWNSFPGQIRHAISSVDELADLIDLPSAAAADITRVTKNYRMRLTPY